MWVTALFLHLNLKFTYSEKLQDYFNLIWSEVKSQIEATLSGEGWGPLSSNRLPLVGIYTDENCLYLADNYLRQGSY